ncbi:MAG: hypothetical protein EBR09_11960 [Proteobacteria bacterium]|nr:hypothetical protein [Pseudomonadota bacterium]
MEPTSNTSVVGEKRQIFKLETESDSDHVPPAKTMRVDIDTSIHVRKSRPESNASSSDQDDEAFHGTGSGDRSATSIYVNKKVRPASCFYRLLGDHNPDDPYTSANSVTLGSEDSDKYTTANSVTLGSEDSDKNTTASSVKHDHNDPGSSGGSSSGFD